MLFTFNTVCPMLNLTIPEDLFLQYGAIDILHATYKAHCKMLELKREIHADLFFNGAPNPLELVDKYYRGTLDFKAELHA